LTFEQHRIECDGILKELLAAPAFPFDDELPSRLPTQHGLYTIKGKTGSGPHEFLHAGRSKTVPDGLRDRIWSQHFCGGGKGAGSDLVDKVVKKQFQQLGIPQDSITNRKTRPVAQSWMRENCQVQWLVLEDAESRCWAEHYVLAVLRPIWGR
jgi:hypothetical protein